MGKPAFTAPRSFSWRLAWAQTIFTENFNTFTLGGASGSQIGNTNQVFYSANLTNWTKAGENAAHMVTYGPSNSSIMIWSGGVANSIKTNASFS